MDSSHSCLAGHDTFTVSRGIRSWLATRHESGWMRPRTDARGFVLCDDAPAL